MGILEDDSACHDKAGVAKPEAPDRALEKSWRARRSATHSRRGYGATLALTLDDGVDHAVVLEIHGEVRIVPTRDGWLTDRGVLLRRRAIRRFDGGHRQAGFRPC